MWATTLIATAAISLTPGHSISAPPGCIFAHERVTVGLTERAPHWYDTPFPHESYGRGVTFNGITFSNSLRRTVAIYVRIYC